MATPALAAEQPATTASLVGDLLSQWSEPTIEVKNPLMNEVLPGMMGEDSPVYTDIKSVYNKSKALNKAYQD
jgi:hypothetical protein